MSDYFLFAVIALEAEMKGLGKNRKRWISTIVDTVLKNAKYSRLAAVDKQEIHFPSQQLSLDIEITLKVQGSVIKTLR